MEKQTPKTLDQIEEDIKKEIRRYWPLRDQPVYRALLYLKIVILKLKRLLVN
ncbi:MAG: hypothetical protein ACWGNI_00405 [Desulfobacterales bacterium]